MRSIIDPTPEAEPAAAASPPEGGALSPGTGALGAPAAGSGESAGAGPPTGAPRLGGTIIGLGCGGAALAGPL